MSGNVVRSRGGVTDQAIIGLANKLGLFGFSLIDCVKYSPQFRIGDRKFHDIAQLAIADVKIVIEVNRPRCAWANSGDLKTRFGINQRLRFWRDGQGFQQGVEISTFGVIPQFDFSRVEFRLQLCDRIGGSCLGVIDRLSVEVFCRERTRQ